MLAATDTDFAPWYVADSNNKKRARLNIISHLLAQIPYESPPRKRVELPARQKPGGYRSPITRTDVSPRSTDAPAGAGSGSLSGCRLGSGWRVGRCGRDIPGCGHGASRRGGALGSGSGALAEDLVRAGRALVSARQ